LAGVILAWFEVDAKERFIEVLRQRFNIGATYKGRILKWDTVIQEKTSELAKYLNGRSRTLDFSAPAPILERTDDRELRETILHLTTSEARERGIGKSTLHYLRENASHNESFRLYAKVESKLRGDLVT
jgi:hypothetical protein